MKKILILLLLFSIAVCPCVTTAEEALQGTAAAETAVTTETDDGEMTLFNVRYWFEHRLLPQWFYQTPERMIESIRETGLFDVWRSYAVDHAFEVTYGEDAFEVREIMQDSGITMLLLSMPEPENTLICYRIYLCFDPETRTAAYYTAEFDRYEGFFDDGCLICGWDEDGTHRYYTEGQILPDRSDPEFESMLAEEATTVLNLMRDRIRTDAR